MDKIIKITDRNRDGAKLWFEQIDNNIYAIKTDKNFVLEYCRFIFENIPADSIEYDHIYNDRKVKYKSFDPSGGPFISVGDVIAEKYKLKRIFVEDKMTKFFIEEIEQIG
jgi:hypothetical protein